jgi:hypothetical protein
MDNRISNITFQVSTDKDTIEIPGLNQTIETRIEEMEPEEKYVVHFKINILISYGNFDLGSPRLIPIRKVRIT